MEGSFPNRAEAGRLLGLKLSKYAGRDDVIVLGLPRGGVPVAFEVAQALRVPLDVFIVRKLGVPGFEELAAGAIASGRAVNHETLASTAHVGYDTAAKIVDYLGPLIKARREHNPELKMTPEVVYRWCGEHARYILSWCRRHGYADIATRVTAARVG